MLRISFILLLTITFVVSVLPQSLDKVYFQPRWASPAIIQLSGESFSGRWRGNTFVDICRPCTPRSEPLVLALNGGISSRSGASRDRIQLDERVGPLTIGDQSFNARGFIKVFFEAPRNLPLLTFGRRIRFHHRGPAVIEAEIHEQDNQKNILYKDKFEATCSVWMKTNRDGGQRTLFSTDTLEYFCDRNPEE